MIVPLVDFKSVVANDGRVAISSPYLRLTGNGAFLEATDSYAAVQIPVPVDDGDEQGHIPMLALKLLGKKREKREITCRADAVEIKPLGVTVNRLKDTFPNLPDIFDKLDAEETAATICLDAKKLAAVAAALGSNQVRLVINGDRKAIKVEPLHGGGRALLMPVVDVR